MILILEEFSKICRIQWSCRKPGCFYPEQMPAKMAKK